VPVRDDGQHKRGLRAVVVVHGGIRGLQVLEEVHVALVLDQVSL
jgi:hypothetical protein